MVYTQDRQLFRQRKQLPVLYELYVGNTLCQSAVGRAAEPSCGADIPVEVVEIKCLG